MPSARSRFVQVRVPCFLVLVVLAVLVCGSAAAADPRDEQIYLGHVDFTWIPPARDFVSLRELQQELRVPPLLNVACNDPPTPGFGEDYFWQLLAKVELLRMLETSDGTRVLQRALLGAEPRMRDPGDHYKHCLGVLAGPDWSKPILLHQGPSGQPGFGWASVALDLAAVPEFSGKPGTGCGGSHGVWDFSMATMLRVWLRGRVYMAEHFDVSDLEKRVARAVWLQGPPAPNDQVPCHIVGEAVPETENHQWLIATTRYLHNEQQPPIPQAEIDAAGGEAADYDVGQNSDNENNGVSSLLRFAMLTTVDHDFVEYNSRPYSRYQMLALLNLYDLAQDLSIRRAAQAVLDFESTKIAAESMSGLRASPFRRRLDDWDPHLFDGDPVTPMYQVWSGNLAPMSFPEGLSEQAHTMVLAASSDYRPPDVLTDVMLNPQHHSFLETFDGAGQDERAYGARDFTITGGGQTTGCPLPYHGVGSPVSGDCPGSANDHGVAERIMLLPRRHRTGAFDDLVEQDYRSVIHSTLTLPFFGASPTAALNDTNSPGDRAGGSNSCIGIAIACGPSFVLGQSRPIGTCSRSNDGKLQGETTEAWRFDRACAGPRYEGDCFFVFVHSFRAARAGALNRPPLAYLITHECNLQAASAATNRLFSHFYGYLTTGAGASTRPPEHTHCTPLCSLSLSLRLPRPSGDITAGTRVTVSADDGGVVYSLDRAPIHRGASLDGSLAVLEPPPAGSPFDPRERWLTIRDPGAGEEMHERDEGGIVYGNSDQSRPIASSASLSLSGVVSGRVTATVVPDLIRSVTVDLEDATAFGAGCTLANGKQGCYSIDTCTFAPCNPNGPQHHHWQRAFTDVYAVGQSPPANAAPIRYESSPRVVDPTHTYWIRTCLTWQHFLTAEDYKNGYTADAHLSCNTIATTPRCTSIICRERQPPIDVSPVHFPLFGPTH